MKRRSRYSDRRSALQRLRIARLSAGFVLTCSLLDPGSVLGQLAENNRGFPPNSAFAITGLDSVNLFSNNVVVAVPIGPEYPIGPGFTHQVRLTYNAQIWQPKFACHEPTKGQEVRGVYVQGSPLLGAGWDVGLARLRGGTDTLGFHYVAPEGSIHQFKPPVGGVYTTEDSSFIRARGVTFSGGTPTYGEVDFPSGDTGIFSQLVPSGSVQHGSTPSDFEGDSLYITRLVSPFGDYAEFVYVGSPIRISEIRHYRSTGFLLRTISFSYVANLSVAVGSTSNTWTVLDAISLPGVGGSQLVKFHYYTNGFDRTSQDTTAVHCPIAARSRSEVAAPLLWKIELDGHVPSPQLKYTFDYHKGVLTSPGPSAGVIKNFEVPTGGGVAYQWADAPSAPGGAPGVLDPSLCPFPLPPDCIYNFHRIGVPKLQARTEHPDGLGVPSSRTWSYFFQTIETDPSHQITQVTAPDGYRVRHIFQREPNFRADAPANGLLVAVEHLDSANQLIRKTRYCYEGDQGGSNVCGPSSALTIVAGNVRQSYTETSTHQPGGAAQQTSWIQRTNWDNYGHFSTEATHGWTGAHARTVTTTWAANPGDWILNIYSARTIFEGGSTLTEGFEFDPGNGFLRGTTRHSLVEGANRIFLTCRYGDGLGNVYREFSASYPLPPQDRPCELTYPNWPTPPNYPFVPVIGLYGDAFGRQHTYHAQRGTLIKSQWVRDNSETALGWSYLDQDRDPSTDLVTTSRDPAGLPTSTSYDLIGRVASVTPPGETASIVEYATSPYRVTVRRNGTDDNSTWEQFRYDGFGRLVREIRQMPVGYAYRVREFDSVGRESFVSEWESCSSEGNCAAAARPAGTSFENFDPFGRPRLIRKADNTTTAIDFTDGTAAFSDTRKAVTTNNLCIGGAGCPGGTTATTVYRYDVFGRLVSVTEPPTPSNPTGATTSYTYDFNDKLIGVTQGGQTRSFVYDAAGNLRVEITPEKGQVDYSEYGSLGNLLLRNEGGIITSQLYDAAGRVTAVTAGGVPYVTNCYDGSTVSPCSHGGGTFRLGKLTQRIAENQASPVRMTENFTYSSSSGRLSQKGLVLTGTPRGTVSATQNWGYNSLGLVSSHTHPVLAGDPAVTSTYSYVSGLPTGLTVGGVNRVLGVSYHPAGTLSAWTGGNAVTTTISQDAVTLLPRPKRIHTSNTVGAGFDFNPYSYDGAGNILGIGSDTFGYDSLARLTSYTVSQNTGSYQYDRYGNPSFLSVDPGTNRISAAAGAAYDSRGNLLRHAGKSYAYDHLSRQTWFNGGAERYIYDGANERVARLTGGSKFFALNPCRVADTRGLGFTGEHGPPTLSAGTTRTMTLTGYCGIPLGATAVSGNLTAVGSTQGFLDLFPAGTSRSTSTLQFKPNRAMANNFQVGLSSDGRLSIYAHTTTDAILDVTGYFLNTSMTLTLRDESNRVSSEYLLTPTAQTRTKDYFYFGNLLAATRDSAGSYLYYASDHLGTPRLVTRQDRTVAESHTYRPFGQQLLGPFGNQPLKFAQMERDAASLNDYDHARYQDPAQSRFLSPDLLQGDAISPQTWNRYTYVAANPLRFVDLDGKVISDAFDVYSYNESRTAWDRAAHEFLRNPSASTGLAAAARFLENAFDSTALLLPGVPAVAGASRKAAVEMHHIATDKALKSGFTAQFERIFARAGMTLQDAANLIPVPGHKGRHSKAYHRYVLDTLETATRGLRGQAYREALLRALRELGELVLKDTQMLGR